MSEEEKIGDMLIKTVDKTWSRAIDAFVAELEQQTWELSEGQGVVVKLEVIKQTAQRLKGEG